MGTEALDPRDQRPRAPAVADAMGESSFPASDPPATWTWDPGGRPPRRRPPVTATDAPEALRP